MSLDHTPTAIETTKSSIRLPEWVGCTTSSTVRKDALAGLTGATLVLPQGIAFASIAGLPAEYGFYTAMITPIVAALFGSSWHTISGPTTAISALVFGALSGLYEVGSSEFIRAAIVLAFLVGMIQLGFGLARLGNLVNFVSHSVMIGFITAAALLIALSQVRHALSLNLPRPEDLVEFVETLFLRLPQADHGSVLIAVLSISVAVVSKKTLPSWPNYLFALAVGTGAAMLLGDFTANVPTIGTLNGQFPNFAFPILEDGQIRNLIGPAFAIAIVGLLEAMSISQAIAMRSGQEISSNKEFKAQGLSNIVGSFFSCYPGSASFTRSGVNYEAGAQTPLAAIFSAVFLFAILQLVAPYFAYVPIPAMAGVIIAVAWKLINLKEIVHIFKTSRSEASIAGLTMFTAIFIDLEIAIYSGVVLSIAFFVNTSAKPQVRIGTPDPSKLNRSFQPISETGLPMCPQMVICAIDGPLFFGSVASVRQKLREIERTYPDSSSMILNINGAGQLDLPAAELLAEEGQRRFSRGGKFYIQTKVPSSIKKLRQFKVLDQLGDGCIYMHKSAVISAAIGGLDHSKCDKCPVRIFKDCPLSDS